jgi:predicted N-acetyltransferase YhbS
MAIGLVTFAGGSHLPIIRLETPKDVDSIRYVNDPAFGREDESKLIEKLRKHGVLAISLVNLGTAGLLGILHSFR